MLKHPLRNVAWKASLSPGWMIKSEQRYVIEINITVKGLSQIPVITGKCTGNYEILSTNQNIT